MVVYKYIIQKQFLQMSSRKPEKAENFISDQFDYARESDCLLQNGLLSRRSDWSPRFYEKRGNAPLNGLCESG